MICTYTYENGEPMTYSELLDWLDAHLKEKELDKLSDIVFSKADLISTLNKLDTLRLNYEPINSTVSINGEPGYKDLLTILDFFDTNLWKHTVPYNEADHRESYIRHAVLKLNLTEEQATQEFDKLFAHLKRVLEDATHIHKLYSDTSVWDPSKSDIDFRAKVSRELVDLLKTPTVTISLLYNSLNKWYQVKKGSFNSTARSNINLSCELKEAAAKVFGHIDYLFVGDDGTLRIYLFKTSESPYRKWPKIKRERFNYLLAFLKRMLQNKGIKVDNAVLNIVPVLLVYDENDKITDIKVEDTLEVSTSSSGTYIFDMYDRNVAEYLDDNSESYHISEEPIKRAVEVTLAMFLNLHIVLEGIRRSAKVWIDRAAEEKYNGFPLVIKHIGDLDHAYDVIIGDKTYAVKNPKPKNSNPEILEIVKEHISELRDSRGYLALKLKDAIKNRYTKGFSTFSLEKGFQEISTKLELLLLAKYFSYKTEKDGSKTYDWLLLDNLLDCNVLIFKNRKTNILDIINISAFDLHAQAPFNKGDSVLGDFKRNIEYVDLEGTYGNVETVKTMNLLNEILPSLGEVRLGTVSTLSTEGTLSMLTYNISEFSRKYYLKIVSVVNKETGIGIHNNFSNALFQDAREELITTYNNIMTNLDSAQLSIYDTYSFKDYINAKTNSELLNALYLLLKLILSIYRDFAEPGLLELVINNNDKSMKHDLAVLYNLITNAYLTLTGETPKAIDKLDKVELDLFTALTVSDLNIRTVVNNLLITHDTISSEFLQIFDANIRPKIDEFYKEKGYTSAQNYFIGNLLSVYKNLYDENSEVMSFKNPYDYSNDLTPTERKFLKFALFLIALIRSNYTFEYLSENDDNIKGYIQKHPEYLWVPLKRADKATSRLSKEGIVAKMKNFWKRVSKSAESIDYFLNDVIPEERKILDGDELNFYRMSLKNTYDSNMPTSRPLKETYDNRKNMITEYGKAFFETNVENILIDVLVALISTELYNKLLIGTKALLLKLHATGNAYGNEKIVQDEIDYILKYLKVNVFKTPILSKSLKLIVGAVLPIKTLTTDLLLGGNIVSMFRDLEEGCQLIFIRSLIKLNTDISPKSAAKAYWFVCKNATYNPMAVNLLSKLCLKYRLSNTDLSRISERTKSGRTGIYNFDNFMYTTLRTPDFINRMTLFVARCIEDGTIDVDDLSKSAYYIDENNNLQYDWKKDKRFTKYADSNANKEDIEYKLQRALYLSQIRKYNTDHYNNPITDNLLLDPYSFLEITAIRALGDNIFGSYDRGKKAMYENQAHGILIGMFTTWMNGITNTYFMKPLKNNVTRLKKVLEVDEKGNLLFFTEDGSIRTLAEGGDENLPVWTDEPVIVQGIFYTVKELMRILKNDGKDEFMTYLKSNPQEAANLKKLISDMLMWLLMSILFKYFATPAYLDFKKGMKERSVAENLIGELLYKPSSRSYDLFKGPLNILTFFGEDMNLPYYTVPFLVLNNAGEALFGDKSWKYLMLNNTGFTRSFKDTAFAFINLQEATPGGYGGGSTGGSGATGEF